MSSSSDSLEAIAASVFSTGGSAWGAVEGKHCLKEQNRQCLEK
ncbi:hypothetical protein [Myxosarcina sp. GI1]|nr:hypothetical protein [Myxosarcina sp. GI1]